MITKVKEFRLEQKIQVGESIYVVTSFPTRSMICLKCELPAVSEPSGMKISIANLRSDFLSGKAKFHLQTRGTARAVKFNQKHEESAYVPGQPYWRED